MLTDLQRRKMTRFFRVYDINGSGFIEEADYMRIAHNFAQLRGFKPNATEYAQLEKKFRFVWDYMRKFGDPNRDYSVSLEEFLNYADSVLEDQYAAIEGSTGNFLFELIDGNGDGHITRDEFRTFYRGYDIQDTVVDHIFRRLDLNADSVISAEEFSQIGYDFHHSDDPECPANWFFGPF